MPITKAAYQRTRAQGFYDKFPGRDVAVEQLNFKPPTDNSKGLRIGNFVQIRDVMDEELEAVWAGQKTAKQALDAAVERGNKLLADFARSQQVELADSYGPLAAHEAQRQCRAPRHDQARHLSGQAAALPAGRAADRDHVDLLHLAGGAGGRSNRCSSRARSAAMPSSSGWRISPRCSATRTTFTPCASRSCSARRSPSSVSRSRCCWR